MATSTLSKIRPSSIGKVDSTKQDDWLRQHKHEYIGQWVVLDGDRLIGYGNDPRPLVKQAKEEGVKIPFIHFIRDESEPFCGAWL